MTLVISNIWYLKLCSIWNNLSGPVFGIWLKQKSLSIWNLEISNFCLCQTNCPVPWVVFSRYLKFFPKFPKRFAIFLHKFLKKFFFQLPLEQLLQLYGQKWVKTPMSNFSFLFLNECFDSIFLIPRIFYWGDCSFSTHIFSVQAKSGGC